MAKLEMVKRNICNRIFFAISKLAMVEEMVSELLLSAKCLQGFQIAIHKAFSFIGISWQSHFGC